MRWKMVERTMKRKRGVAEDEETGLMYEVEGKEGQANSVWCGARGQMEDSGKWRMRTKWKRKTRRG